MSEKKLNELKEKVADLQDRLFNTSYYEEDISNSLGFFLIFFFSFCRTERRIL